MSDLMHSSYQFLYFQDSRNRQLLYKKLFFVFVYYFSVTHCWKHKLSTCHHVNYILLTLNVIVHLVIDHSVRSTKKPTLSLSNEHTLKFHHPNCFPILFQITGTNQRYVSFQWKSLWEAM